jgi:glycogen synthase
MTVKNMLISGDINFVNRYSFLFKAIGSQCDRLSYLYGDKPFESNFLNQLAKIPHKLKYQISASHAIKSQSTGKAFIEKSRQTGRRIRRLSEQPSFVLQIFGMYAPFWEPSDIPYGMFLDYTAILAHQSQNLPLSQDFRDWQTCERLAYQRARHLFPMSQVVKSSLVNDYSISADKITVVGSFANRHPLYQGEKKFGGKQLLFNGSDFERKGGDLVLKAFKQIRKFVPEAKLIVIGKKIDKIDAHEDGVINIGKIESVEQMRQLFLETDVILAPGRCDPFPSFTIEGMNYGVPCVVSNKDGMPEIVDRDINGVVVDTLTPDAIAEKAIDLLNNIPVLTSMSKQARQKVKLQLNCDSVAQKIIQALH